MTVSLALAPIAAILGLILYFVPTNVKITRVGEILFFVGSLAFLLTHK